MLKDSTIIAIASVIVCLIVSSVYTLLGYIAFVYLTNYSLISFFIISYAIVATKIYLKYDDFYKQGIETIKKQ